VHRRVTTNALGGRLFPSPASRASRILILAGILFAAAGIALPGQGGAGPGGSGAAGSGAAAGSGGGTLAPHVPGEVLIQFTAAASSYDHAAMLGLVGGQVRRLFGAGTERWSLGDGVSTEQAIARIAGNPRVRFVEPNYIVHASRAPNDPHYPSLWGLHNTGQSGGVPGADIDAERAWNVSTGSRNIKVAVIDTGVDYNHPDLAANIWTNPGEIAGNGIDDDHNGFVDDVHGWDFANDDNNPTDDVGHGTHVAGTIGAIGNNGVGVVGVNWQVTIVPVKFLGSDGSGATSDAINAIDYATQIGARVMNNSWGGGGFSQALLDAIRRANNAGALFVAAAGNNGTNNDLTPAYPSNYDSPNIIAVAALDRGDRLASFSNYGRTTVDLGAPGVAILSTFPGGGYTALNGTSMAAPHVSGAAALLLSANPDLSVSQVRQRLLLSAVPIPALAGVTTTGGRLNAFLPLASPDTIPPGPIADLAAGEATSYSLTLHWTATGDDGATGTAATYDVRYSTSPIDASTFTAAAKAADPPDPLPAGAAQQMQVTGLAFGTPYYFAIKTRDEWDNTSAISNVAAATTLGPPHLTIDPPSASASLFTGGRATQVVTLDNSGVGELTWSLEVQGARVAGIAISPSSAAPAVVAGAGRAGRGLHPEAGGGRPSPVTPAPGPGGPPARYAGTQPPRRPLLSPVESREPVTQGARLRILILGSGGTPAEIQGLLAAFPDVATVDLFDAAALVPTLDYLETYNSVIVTSDVLWGDPAAVGDVLADYADSGGGVVLTLASFIDGWALAGRFVSGGYSPFQIGYGPGGSSPLGSFDATHPIMRGVTQATGDVLGIVNLSTGAVPVAAWANGFPFVAVKGTNVAAINVFVAESGYWTGDIPLILHNAAIWSGKAVTWLAAEPKSGVVPIGGRADITLEYDATGLSGGDYDARLELTTNDPDAAAPAVPVSLHVTGAPDVSLSAQTIDFGSPFVGGIVTKTLTVANVGAAVLHVDHLAVSGADFSAEPEGFVLGVQQQRDVEVSFFPTRAGSGSATLTIVSDDPDTPSATVALTGTGLPPPIVAAEPAAVAATLFTGGRQAVTLTLRNSGGSPLEFTSQVSEPGAAGGFEATAAAATLGAAAMPGASGMPGTAGTGGFDALAVSPEPLTCVVEDRAAGLIYAQADGGRNFYRYRVATNNWEPLASCPFNSGNDGGAALLGGKVYTAYTVNPYNLGVYDIATDSWTNIANPLGDVTGNIASDDTGSLYLAGGLGFVRYDVATGTKVVLPPPPFPFQPWGGLRVFDGAVYGHAGNGGSQFARFLIASNVWQQLPSIPRGAVLGATIDPVAREYVAYGNYGEANLFRYSIRDDSWKVTTIPFFNVDDGGLAWMPDAPSAIYFIEGQNGVRFARLRTTLPFVAVAPDTGVVAPAGSIGLQVQFDAASLAGGTYRADILFDSNDPRTPELTVPATMTVVAAPDLSASPGGLDFGSQFVGLATERILRVRNVGVLPLHVGAPSIDEPEFATDVAAFDLDPGAERLLTVTYGASRPGSSSGVLTIPSDDPDSPATHVALQGQAVVPPVIAISPGSLNESLPVGASVSRTVTIRNAGGSDLAFSISQQAPAGLDARAASAVAAAASVAATALPDATGLGAAVELGATSTDAARGSAAGAPARTITAGTGVLIIEDSYPWGTTSNEAILTALGIPYDVVGSSDLPFVDLHPYHLVLVPSDQSSDFYLRLAAQSAQIDSFVTAGGVLEFHAAGWGSLDGDASQVTLPGGMHIHLSIATGNRVLAPAHPLMHGVPDPFYGLYVSHAYFTEIPQNAEALASDEAGNVDLVVYRFGAGLVVTGCQTFEYSFAVGQDAGTILMNMIPFGMAAGVEWVHVAPVEGNVAPGSSADVKVEVDAHYLLGGDYATDLVVQSSDPFATQVRVPVRLHVTGVPDIELSASSLDFGTQLLGDAATRSVTLGNNGTDLLHVTALTLSDPDYTTGATPFDLPVGETRDVTITFRPTRSGSIPATLGVTSNDPDQPHAQVALSGTGRALNEPPTAAFSGGGSVECTGPDGALVGLNGSASSDPDSTPGTNDDIASYAWYENYGTPGERLLGSGPTLAVTLPLGEHAMTLKVTDRAGASGTAMTPVTVADTQPPSLTVYSEPAILWPPTHEMVPVHLRLAAQDRCDPSVRTLLVSVTSSEADDAAGNGDGATANDVQDVDPGSADADVLLRAERDSKGSGRVYTLTYRALDAAGNQATGLATVTVPHDQGHGPEPLLMRLSPAASGSTAARIVWPAQDGATGYNVISGTLSAMHVVDGVLNLGAVRVLARGTQGSSVDETAPAAPPVGQGYFYLIEQVTAWGATGYGTESAPWPRVPGSCEGGCPGAGTVGAGGGPGGDTTRR